MWVCGTAVRQRAGSDAQVTSDRSARKKLRGPLIAPGGYRAGRGIGMLSGSLGQLDSIAPPPLLCWQ